MTWWKKVLNGILIAISGYEIGKEMNTEKQIVKFEPVIHEVAKNDKVSENWPINGNALFIILLILMIILICVRYYIKLHLSKPRNVTPRI